MPLPAPINGIVLASVLLPPSLTVQFTGSAGVDHYDIYRSLTAKDIGSKINVAPIAEPGSPFNFQFIDDGISSISAPPVGMPVFYRAVAADVTGNISLPSSALPVTLQASTQVVDSTQMKIYQALIADQTLNGLLANDSVNRIRFHHIVLEQGNDVPFVVFWKLPQKEDKKMRNVLRRISLNYMFEVYDNTNGSARGRQIKERIIKVLDQQEGLLTDCSVTVFSMLFLDGGTDLYDERMNLWFYSTKAELIAELQDV